MSFGSRRPRRRFGYRRIHDLLRPEHPGINHKRVYRLYKAADLAVRKRRKAKRPMSERVPLQAASMVNEAWSMDFVSDSLVNCRRLKCLTVADDCSHEYIDIPVDYGISGQYVTRLLDQAAIFRGYPKIVRTDNGPEFTSRAFMGWALRVSPLRLLRLSRSTSPARPSDCLLPPTAGSCERSFDAWVGRRDRTARADAGVAGRWRHRQHDLEAVAAEPTAPSDSIDAGSNLRSPRPWPHSA